MNKDSHVERFLQQTPEDQLLSISSNLRRVSNWAYNYSEESQQKNIKDFLEETANFVNAVEEKKVPERFLSRFRKFKKDFPKLKDRWDTASDNHMRRLVWAEEILTWSNLLS